MVSERPHASISTLHKQWVKLEDEHHRLAIAIDEARSAGADLAPMRQRQIEHHCGRCRNSRCAGDDDRRLHGVPGRRARA